MLQVDFWISAIPFSESTSKNKPDRYLFRSCSDYFPISDIICKGHMSNLNDVYYLTDELFGDSGAVRDLPRRIIESQSASELQKIVNKISGPPDRS